MPYPVDNVVVYDLEVYPGWFLLGAHSPDGQVIQLEATGPGQAGPFQAFLDWVRANGYTLAGFNSLGYDDLVLTEFLRHNGDPQKAFEASQAIIVEQRPRWQFDNEVNSIDLMQILPGRIGLKVIGVRLGHAKLQELPVPWDKVPNQTERETLKRYNINDLEITRKLYNQIKPELDLRSTLSDQYGVDLRSKGEATLAELIILHEAERKGLPANRKALNGEARNYIEREPRVYVQRPTWWDTLMARPRMDRLRVLGEEIFKTPIPIVDGRLARGVLDRQLFIDDRYYTMGVGGLHSVDGPGCWVPGEDEVLVDIDVSSYYPSIVLTQDLWPRAWGPAFLDIYRDIVERRLKAKREGDTVTARVLKISANGTYGKSSDLFSSLYDPQLTVNVTVLGQLGLLVLIQMLEGVATVCSANTDGVAVMVKRSMRDQLRSTVREWEQATGLEMEFTEYLGLYQRDCNNYLALKQGGKVKTKGRFGCAWPDLRHSPNANIVALAIRDRLAHGTPFEETVYGCEDINQFVLTQKVTGGWTTSWNSQPLGKMLRFIKSNRPDAAPIIRSPGPNDKGKEGIVPDSERCVPLDDLPDRIPPDLNYSWYLNQANKLWEVITQPKRPGMNRWAEVLYRQGLRPCMVDPKAKMLARGRVTYGQDDFTSLPPGWVIGTGTGEGLLAKLEPERTEVYEVTRPFPTRSRTAVRTKHGFDLIYGARVPLHSPFFSIIQPENEAVLDDFYTPAELKKVCR